MLFHQFSPLIVRLFGYACFMASKKRSPLSLTLTGFFITFTAGFLTLARWAKKNKFQSPAFLLRYLTKPHSKVGPLFATRQLRHSDVPIEIPEKLKPIEQIVSWKGSHRGLSWVLRETETNVLLVAKNGVLVRRWCRPGFTEATLQSSWSVAKSVVGLVAGQLISEGKLTEKTKLVDVLPEFSTGGPFDEITVAHLLDMRSGIDVAEEYKEWQAYTGVGGMMTSKDLTGYLMRRRNTFAVPGEIADYRSVDTQFLSMIITRIEGKNLAAVVRSRIWDPVGAVDSATWTLDDEGGIEKGFMGLNASARDFLKIGLLVANEGMVGEKRVIPAEFIERIKTAKGIIESDAHRWGYSSKWWHPAGAGETQDLTALGVYGQYVYINPEHDVVITKLSDYGTEQDEDDIIQVFRELAASV